ncbi:MAG TPA: hypothetical protein DD502_02120 [Cupriavidus sp.]|nr:hypothetical protein [Cupriavidus sp.]
MRETEVAIKTRFGKAGEANLGPGFHFRLPWPVHDVHIFDNRIQSSEWTFEETGTKEGKPILIKVFVTWKISDALKFFNSFSGDLAKANEVLEGKVRSIGYGVSTGQSPPPGSLPTVQNSRDWLRPAQRFPVIVDIDPGQLSSMRGVRVGGQAEVMAFPTSGNPLNPLGRLYIRLMSWLSYVY